MSQCGKAGSGEGEFNKPWGIALDKDGNIYVADWKNHRVQKLSPKGKFLMSIGRYGKVPGRRMRFAVTYLGPFISSVPDAERRLRRASSITPRVSRSIPTATSMLRIGAITGSAFSTKMARPLTHLVGDAQVMSKWGQQSIDANPDMMKAYRRVQNLEQLWRFCFPTAVVFNPKTDQIIVADSQRNRLQIYKKMRDYVDFQANL